jgi:F0F1-type ATP synthase delta subunit
MKKEIIKKAKRAYLNSLTTDRLDQAKINAQIAKIIAGKNSEILPLLIYYKKLIEIQLKKEKAIVTTIIELNNLVKKEITRMLKKTYKKVTDVSFQTNKNVLGGAKIQVGDMVYDFSLDAKLKLLEDIDG